MPCRILDFCNDHPRVSGSLPCRNRQCCNHPPLAWPPLCLSISADTVFALQTGIETMRRLSLVAPQWWDYTTLDREILDAAARLTVDDLQRLSRPGFTVQLYDTLEDFYLAEA